MSKKTLSVRSDAGGQPAGSSPSRKPDPSPESQPPIQHLPPLRPRPTLFRALMVALAIWVAALIALYVKDVYPLRHGNHASSATTPTVPLPPEVAAPGGSLPPGAPLAPGAPILPGAPIPPGAGVTPPSVPTSAPAGAIPSTSPAAR